jgi:hypothetical protein
VNDQLPERALAQFRAERPPDRHTASSERCPSIPVLVRIAATGDPEGHAPRHLDACRACTVALTTAWEERPPSLRQLIWHALGRHPLPRTFGSHVAGCEDCRARMERSFVKAVRRLQDLAAPAPEPVLLSGSQPPIGRDVLGGLVAEATMTSAGRVTVAVATTRLDLDGLPVRVRLEPVGLEVTVAVGQREQVSTDRPVSRVVVIDIAEGTDA